MSQLIVPRAKNLLFRYFSLTLLFLLLLFFLLSTYQANLFSSKWRGAFDQYITVQIPSFDLDKKQISDEQIEDLLTIAKKTKGVLEVDIYSEQEVKHIFESQMIHIQDIENLNLPRLLEVKIENQKMFNFALFKQDLQAIIANVEIIIDQQLLMPYLKSAQFAEYMGNIFSICILLGIIISSLIAFRERIEYANSYWHYLFDMGCNIQKLFMMIIRPQVKMIFISSIGSLLVFYLFFYWGHNELKILLPHIFSGEIWSSIMYNFFMISSSLIVMHIFLSHLYFRRLLKKWSLR